MSARDAVLAAMRDPAFYGLPRGTEVVVRETHASFVFLAGERAYKVKKPVTLAFLDYGTLEQRRALCLEEVRVNREYAPRTYIGVRAVVPAGDGFALEGADDPRAVEYAVEMRRLDERRTLDRLVRDGRAGESVARRLARRVAELHAAAPAVRVVPAELLAPVRENLEALRAHAGTLVGRATFDAIERYVEAFAHARQPLISARIEAGRVRECHGDLRLEHVVTENGFVIFDRIEFDERFRRIDVAADIAFTAMDFERLGARALADAFVGEYAEASSDEGMRSILPFYSSYRAAVRAKVACTRLRQLAPGAVDRAALERDAHSLLDLSLRFVWRSRLPLALVFCGVAGSGKSRLATELARRSGLPRVSSDEIRKRLAGLAPTARGGPDLYSAEHTARTYDELARAADVALREAGGVILDATFHEHARRQALRNELAPTGARVIFCECRAPEEVLRRRGEARERAAELGSDATWEVIAKQLASFEPLDEVPPRDHLVIATDRSVEESLAAVEALVGDAVDRTGIG